jgi:hypothetical protein
VTPSLIAYLDWRHEFEKALDPRFYTIGYLDGLVWSGRAFFFDNTSAAAVAELKVYPTGLCDIHGLVAAGELAGIVDLIEKIEVWAKARGCSGAIIESRPGWQKVLKSKRYDPHQIAVRKEL